MGGDAGSGAAPVGNAIKAGATVDTGGIGPDSPDDANSGRFPKLANDGGDNRSTAEEAWLIGCSPWLDMPPAIEQGGKESEGKEGKRKERRRERERERERNRGRGRRRGERSERETSGGEKEREER